MAHYTLPHNDHVHAHLLPLAIMLVASINFIWMCYQHHRVLQQCLMELLMANNCS